MAVSVAIVMVLQKEFDITLADKTTLVAGHSLGEYSALAASGALSIADTAQLLKRRGQAMQQAVPVGEGAMAALLGLDLEAVQEVAVEAAHDGYGCANDNALGQVEVSGAKAAVERAIEIAGVGTAGSDVAGKRTISLSLMRPAADAMAGLGFSVIRQPVVPLVTNVTAEQVIDPDAIRTCLIKQVTAMVRWRESVLYMKEQGVDTLIEVGAGRVLSGLARRIDSELTGKSIQQPDDFEAIVKNYKESILFNLSGKVR